jgi:hypothetical protein
LRKGRRNVKLSIVWLMEWDGITPEQYEALRQGVGWETDVPDGLQFHVAAFSDKGLVLTEVWRSPDHVQPFMDGRFLPVVKELGIKSMPRVDLYPVHRLFVPSEETRHD